MRQDALPYSLKGPIFILHSPAQQEKVGRFMLPSPEDWPVLHPPEHLEGPHQQVLSEDLMWMVCGGVLRSLSWFAAAYGAESHSFPTGYSKRESLLFAHTIPHLRHSQLPI